MTSRAKLRADAEARRKQAALADWLVRHPPLWPWDAAQWQAPAAADSRRPGRPPKPQRPVDRMMEARGVLYRRYVKKAATAQAAGPAAAAARRQIGDRLRKRVLARVPALRADRVPTRRWASRIAIELETAGLQIDAKHIREILRSAARSPAK